MPYDEEGEPAVTAGDGLEAIPLGECALLLRPDDDVAVATCELRAGTRLLMSAARELVLGDDVPRGHKLAVRDLPAGSAVHKYGQSIGRATVDIAVGAHVHTHNLGMDDTDRDYEFGTARTQLPAASGPPRTFQGYYRANGLVGTRNFVGVLTSVNCSASSAKMIADQFRGTHSPTSTAWWRSPTRADAGSWPAAKGPTRWCERCADTHDTPTSAGCSY